MIALLAGCQGGTCKRNGDCVGADVCDLPTSTCVAMLGSRDPAAGSDPSALAGDWTVEVTMKSGGTGAPMVSRHTVTATLSGDTITFSTRVCSLKATVSGSRLTLLPNQTCSIPLSTPYELFDNGTWRSDFTSYCYALGTKSGSTGSFTARTVSIANVAGELTPGSCSIVSPYQVTFDFDFTR
ncbi:MAG: hypothetical protein QM817_26380 [Archangium sp.]